MFYKLLDATESVLYRQLKSPLRCIIFNAGMMLRNQPTDMDLDKKIVEYLNDPNITPVRIDEYLVKIGDLELWGENIPYGSFTYYPYGSYYDAGKELPRRTTVLKILKALGEYPFDKLST
jgi:hypothetical protein